MTDHEKNPETCPACRQTVKMVPARWSQRGNDPLTYPWVFVEHYRAETWGGEAQRRACPGSGCNPALAARGGL